MKTTKINAVVTGFSTARSNYTHKLLLSDLHLNTISKR